MMAINKEEYTHLKEYWDYQRKVEYNKEQVFNMTERFEGRVFNDFGPVSVEDFKETLWAKVPSSEYEDPPKEWIPSNEKYRFDWEGDPNEIKRLTTSKGRPVILKAKAKDEQLGNK